jgi:hypothetical protein
MVILLIVPKSDVVSPVADLLMTSFLDFRVADGRSWRRRFLLTNLERFDYSALNNQSSSLLLL